MRRYHTSMIYTNIHKCVRVKNVKLQNINIYPHVRVDQRVHTCYFIHARYLSFRSNLSGSVDFYSFEGYNSRLEIAWIRVDLNSSDARDVAGPTGAFAPTQ